MSKILKHQLPELKELIVKEIKDPRRKKSCTYPIESIILSVIAMYLLRCGSRNSFNNDGRDVQWDKNFKQLFGVRMPHMDTVDQVMERIDETLMERLKVELIRVLLGKRVFHKFKRQGKFIISIDGTGVFKFSELPYENCPHKTSKHAKLTYHQPVVEAKLVGSNGMSLSVCTEFVINEDGKTKQDCEYNATLRLMTKLKKSFSRLPITIVLDGLYAKQPIMQKIMDNGWDFHIVWKDKTLMGLQEQIGVFRKQEKVITKHRAHIINQKTRVEYCYEYLSKSLKHKGVHLYYLGVTETTINLIGDNKTEEKVSSWKFMSSVSPDDESIRMLIESARLRWKIENEGFNVQKNHGFALHHKMNRTNLTAIKNYYQALQIAHLLDQLITLCKNTSVHMYGSIIKFWQYVCSELRIKESLEIDTNPIKINLRY